MEQLRWWLQLPEPQLQSREQRLDWLRGMLERARYTSGRRGCLWAHYHLHLYCQGLFYFHHMCIVKVPLAAVIPFLQG